MPGSYTEERTFAKLVARNGEEPAISAECLFVDPIADLAVLGEPDGQELYEECAAYEALIETAAPLLIGKSADPAAREAWLLSLAGRWFSCTVKSAGRGLWVEDASEPIRAGMSG